MQPISCRNCGNRVLVEKYSNEHTSVQWLSDAESACPEFSRRAALGESSREIPTCPSLRQSIDEQAYEGALALSLRSYPTPGRLD
ncbi:hypothetical protein G4H71_13715 [Rhodococcus triatomae]|uniref:Ferredoxin n=1 Tax=Rhodococcus triatomae TaxID=300028 RepID=A0A1G8PMA0_9NOCA|nr:hypothetical protein [Rhodococcus triatomae]QNG20144.1 hypothetical protein G4H72_16660 [Rhodococcus triatomae]QNG23940.1 hypothetical protein G4H71_13715 [Rhodococcus triatomae]SDI93512.1 hypothetical protein SAMN05444695_11377 [Rhodococcus triatomae]